MVAYANRGGDSGVIGFDLGAESILVRFHNGGEYLYTYSSVGRGNVEQMKQLARRGMGLNAFINTNPQVKFGYEAKLR